MPDDIDALMKLGNVLFRQGDYDAAIARFQQVLYVRPDFAAAHYNIGLARQHQNKFEEAIGHYQKALHFQPDLLVAANNLGAALKSLGRYDDAIACFWQILRLKPDYADVHANLGNALAAQDKLEEAVSSYRQALRLRPDLVQTHYNLGFLLSKHGRVDEAAAHLREALRLKPDHVDAKYNLGILLHEQGKLDEALAAYEQVLHWQPEHAGAHLNRAFLWLVTGNWAQGWPENEWRWQLPDYAQRNFSQPTWDGFDLAGKTVLLYAEQGLGDTMQFIRYARLARERGRVILQCQPAMIRLLASFSGIDSLVAKDAACPPFDCHAGLLSTPGALRTTVNSVPAPIPYLHPKPELVKQWRGELQKSAISKPSAMASHVALPTSHLLVGIAWQGNPVVKDDRQRSIPLSLFARLSRVPGARFISLQKGAGTEQLDALKEFYVESYTLDEESGAFMDTAAVMQHLDLVISCDTAVPHLAGALGIPVWIALAVVPDWRWLLEREDTPWYPTMRLFRQRRYGAWDEVFDRMAEELEQVQRGDGSIRIKRG